MSQDANPVSVRILEKEYLIACPEDQANALRESARYLDGKMKEIRGSGKVIGLDRVAVMAALNITHEVLQLRTEQATLCSSFNDRVRNLREKVENTLTEP